MFFVRLIQILLGYINFRADGGNIEKFLNLTAKSEIVLWNIKRMGQSFCASVLSSKYGTIESFAAECGMGISAAERKGMPFLLKKLKKRIGFAVGILIFIALIVYFSGYVWVVDVSGNKLVSSREILYVLDDMGLSPGVRKDSFDKKSIEQQVVMKIPELSWMHINLDGSVAKVKVGERSKKPEIVSDDRPCNIKALTTGQIIKIEVYEGQAMLKAGDTVQKDELIVSGVIEEPKTTITRYVHARAKVIALTSREITVKVPLKTTADKDTGKVKNKQSLEIFKMSIPFYFGTPHGSYRRLVYKRPLIICGRQLPISFDTISFVEYKNVPVTLTQNQAIEKAKSMLAGKEKIELAGAKIVAKNYKQESDANSVTLTGCYKCEEDIAVSKEVRIGETGGNAIIGPEGKNFS